MISIAVRLNWNRFNEELTVSKYRLLSTNSALKRYIYKYTPNCPRQLFNVKPMFKRNIVIHLLQALLRLHCTRHKLHYSVYTNLWIIFVYFKYVFLVNKNKCDTCILVTTENWIDCKLRNISSNPLFTGAESVSFDRPDVFLALTRLWEDERKKW